MTQYRTGYPSLLCRDNIKLREVCGNDAVQIEIPIIDHQDRMVIHTLSKGETFGWAALGESHIRTAIARCLDRVNVICINGKSLLQLLDENNHMGYLIMRNLTEIISTRLSYTTVAFRYNIRKERKILNIGVAT